MSLPNLVPDAELDHIPFDHAAQFTSTQVDINSLEYYGPVIFITDDSGRTSTIRDRRKSDDRRVKTRRLEDHEAAKAAEADRIEDIKAQTRRGWTMLCIGYVIGLATTLALLVVTS